ncbi:MAG: hypothetical protein ACRDRV_01020 [Pseudonocardiaceae bacterium]
MSTAPPVSAPRGSAPRGPALRVSAPRFRLAPHTRKTVVVLHVIASVALLGQVWVNMVLALFAMVTPDAGAARSAYSYLQLFVFTSAIPFTMLSLLTGVVLGVGSKWGVLRYRWVSAKLVLLMLTVLIGMAVQGPLLEQLVVAPSPGVRWAHAAAAGVQFVLLVVATWLSVFKPGGRFRRR